MWWMCRSIQSSFIYIVLIHCVESTVVGHKRNDRNKKKKDNLMQCKSYAGDLKNVLGIVVNEDTDRIVCSSTMWIVCSKRLQSLKRSLRLSAKIKERTECLTGKV